MKYCKTNHNPMGRWLILLVTGLVCLLPVFSQVSAAQEKHSGPYNLSQLIRLANDNNLVLKISRLDKRIAVEEYNETRALENPEIEYATGKFIEPGAAVKPTIWSAGFSWSIPNPLQRHYILKAGRADIQRAEIQQEIEHREVIKELKHHYYKLRFHTKVKTFWQEKLIRLKEVYKITKAKVSIGEAKEIDALRSSVEIQKTKTRLFQIEKQIAYEKTRLIEFLNFALPPDFTVTDDFHYAPLPPFEEKLRRLIDISPRVRLTGAQLKRETAGLKAARSSIIESIGLSGEYEKEPEGKKWKIGIGVSIPLFNQKGAHIRKAKLLKEKAALESDHVKKHFYADLQRIMADIRVLEKEIQTYKSAVLEEGRQNLELTERLYKEGEVSLVVYIDSQNSFFEIQERYFEAVTEWNLLDAELEALLGNYPQQ